MLTLPKNWHDILKEEVKKPYIAELKKFLENEQDKGIIVYPPHNLIFNALRLTPFDQVKVVLIGQDPYHGAGQAHGLSFSVPKGVRPPPSLKNIFKELIDDVGISPPQHGCLESWAAQGVLLLNAVLTVRARDPGSHKGRGWEHFTDAVAAALIERSDPIVFILWGRFAQDKIERIFNAKPHPHLILKATHPSPYSAYSGFFGCRHFSKANQFLIQQGKSPIDWNII